MALEKDAGISPVRQVRPKTEGWNQKLDAEGRPLLEFAAPRGAKPPVHLADLDIEERKGFVTGLGLPAFRAKQIATHYFTHYTTDPEAMTDLPAAGREEIVAKVLPPLLTEVKKLRTDNGDTIKFLWRLFDGALVESVLMRYPGRITLCVSSQAGCGMNCPFCATGQAGLTRTSHQQKSLTRSFEPIRQSLPASWGAKSVMTTPPTA
jgi:23S rRNA (adenine2503-C2)-methyltransferase